MKNREINGTEEIGLVTATATPTPTRSCDGWQVNNLMAVEQKYVLTFAGGGGGGGCTLKNLLISFINAKSVDKGGIWIVDKVFLKRCL